MNETYEKIMYTNDSNSSYYIGFDTSLDSVEKGEVLKYMEYFGYYANQADITTILWDNGQHFSRYDYTWSNQELFDMIKASWSGRSSYTESDHLFVKANEPIKDQIQELILNGNSLVEICDNHRMLKEGKDYIVTGEGVTIKASYLKSVLKRHYGIQTTLTFKFSDGKDWKVDVDRYENAVLQDTEGTTSEFSIPVDYRGDIIKTMEAVDEEGNAVGPQD